MRKALLIVGAGFAFGLFSAYISIQIFNSIDVDSEHPRNHWYDSFMITLSPAGTLNHFTVKLDLSNMYEEAIDKENVLPYMLLNAFAWSLILSFAGFPIFLFNRLFRRARFFKAGTFHG